MFYHPSRSHHDGLHRCHPYSKFGYVHPAAAAFWFSNHNDRDTDDDNKDNEMKNQSTQKKNKIHLSEPKNSFIIKMDIPGVEAHHVTIEESNGELEIMAVRLDGQERVIKTYQDVMYIHPSKANFADLTATLTDGVLTIRVPRRTPKVMTIELEASAPPVESYSQQKKQHKSQGQDRDSDMSGSDSNEDDSGFHVSRDVPGVSLDNLTVKVRDDTLFVFAKRRSLQGRHTTVVHRHSWNVPPSIDMVKAKAYLHCGVFTLIAPRKEAVPSVGVRTFYATPARNDENEDIISEEKEEKGEGEGEELPSVSSLNLDDKSNTNETTHASSEDVDNSREWDMIVDSTESAKKSTDN